MSIQGDRDVAKKLHGRDNRKLPKAIYHRWLRLRREKMIEAAVQRREAMANKTKRRRHHEPA